MQSISNNVNKSTIRVVCDNGIGTGFYFAFKDKDDPNKGLPVLVTNKHVIDGAKKTVLRFNLKNNDKGVKFHDVTIENPEQVFVRHPNPEVDLCVLPLMGIFDNVEKNGFELDYFFFDDSHIAGLSSLTPIEEVYMTGYPNGLWDEVNNKPITRKGITASDVKLKWNGKPQFMIDMACFGGSSGSPVYIMNEGTYAVSGGIALGNRFKFLGVLFAGPILQVDGSVEVIEVPTTTVSVSKTNVMMNLGIVVTSTELLVFRGLLGLK
ncbi:S1 family peptidase [Klebsiella variicola]